MKQLNTQIKNITTSRKDLEEKSIVTFYFSGNKTNLTNLGLVEYASDNDEKFFICNAHKKTYVYNQDNEQIGTLEDIITNFNFTSTKADVIIKKLHNKEYNKDYYRINAIKLYDIEYNIPKNPFTGEAIVIDDTVLETMATWTNKIGG